MIGLVLLIVMVVLLYNAFTVGGGQVPDALKSATLFVEQEERAAASRLAAADAVEKLRRQNPALPSATRVFARALSGAPGTIMSHSILISCVSIDREIAFVNGVDVLWRPDCFSPFAKVGSF